MQFNLALPYVVPTENRTEKGGMATADREISISLIKGALAAKYPKAKKGVERTTVGEIQKKLSLAHNEEEDLVELDGKEFEAVKRSLEEWDAPPQGDWHSWLSDLDRYCESKMVEISEQEKAEKAAKAKRDEEKKAEK